MDHAGRLHPLLTTAAISLTVFSAVGVAALAGLLPASKSSSPPVVAEQPKETAKPVAQVEKPVAAKPKPVSVAKAPRIVEPVVYREFDAPLPPPVTAQAPRVEEAPEPIAQPGIAGTVEAVREVTQLGDAKGIGAVAGGVLGGVLGSQFGRGDGRKLLTVLGAAGGAFAGNHAEKQARESRSWEISVRLDDGSTRTIASAVQPLWHAGDRVRLLDGRLQPV